MENKKPNILIVLSDQQRADTLSCFGVQSGITPILDDIGRHGMIFERCYSVQPVCGPARACIQSGRYATETGNFKNGCTLPEDTNTMSMYAKQMGYETAYIGKWHIYGDQGLIKKKREFDVPIKNRMGYDYWLASNALEFTSHAYDGYLFDSDNHKVPIEGYRADFITSKAIEYLENRDREKPFFMVVSYLEPHQQNDLGKFTGPKGQAERFEKYGVPGDLKEGQGDWESEMPEYLSMCYNLDENVGRIRNELLQEKEWENTLFMYSADHGCHFKTRNGEYKRSCHDASTRVPLVVSGPGLDRGTNSSLLTSILDIPATAVYAMGGTIPDNYRGQPIQTLKEERPILIQISEECSARAICYQNYKYCVSNDAEGLQEDSSTVYYEKFLYDLSKDPYEQNNLIEQEDYIEQKEMLKKKLLELILEVENKRPQIKSARENPYYGIKYSFLMSLNQMLADEKARKVLEEELPMIAHSKLVQLGANIKFSFLNQYFSKIPILRKKSDAV